MMRRALCLLGLMVLACRNGGNPEATPAGPKLARQHPEKTAPDKSPPADASAAHETGPRRQPSAHVPTPRKPGAFLCRRPRIPGHARRRSRTLNASGTRFTLEYPEYEDKPTNRVLRRYLDKRIAAIDMYDMTQRAWLTCKEVYRHRLVVSVVCEEFVQPGEPNLKYSAVNVSLCQNAAIRLSDICSGPCLSGLKERLRSHYPNAASWKFNLDNVDPAKFRWFVFGRGKVVFYLHEFLEQVDEAYGKVVLPVSDLSSHVRHGLSLGLLDALTAR